MYVPAGRRIRGLKRGGFGQLYCPSVLQGAGIVDCTDPCQQGYGDCAGVQPAGIPSLPVGGSSVISSVLSTLATPAPGASSSVSSALPWVLGGVAAIIVLGALSAK